MTDALRRDLEEVAGRSGDRPDLADLWRSGRRRRTRSRAVPVGAAAVLVLLVGTILVLARPGDDGERVTSAGPATCTPAPLPTTGRPPRTAESFVRGGGSGAVLKPGVVARVRVVRVWRVPVERTDLLIGLPPASGPTHERRAEVEVVEEISGARAGERLVVSDAGSARLLDDLEAAKRVVMRQIEGFQLQLDRDPSDTEVQAQLRDYQERLHILQLSERMSGIAVVPTPCHSFGVGDELIVALTNAGLNRDIYELTNPSSFFLITDGQLSPELDAARRSVPGWPDTPLAQLARRSTPDELMAALRAVR